MVLNPWEAIMPRYLLVAFGMLLLVSGCVSRPWLPIPGDKIYTEGNYAVIRSDSLLIAVRPQAYPGNVNSVNTNFFTLYIQTRNLSSKPIRMERNSLSILASGRQYDYVPLDYVLGILRTNFLLTDFQDPFIISAPTQTSNQDKLREDYFELMGNYFSFGDLLPGGMKDGYLFYNRDIHQQKSLHLDLFGQSVEFERK